MNKALKIRVLLDHEENIFRDILIADNDSFETFHNHVLQAFDFPNNQMASFYSSNDEWDKGEEIPLTNINEADDSFIKTMSEVKLGDVLFKKGQKMIYVYDFLLMWCFFVEVVEVAEKPVRVPFVETSYGDAPDPLSKDPEIKFDVDDFQMDEDDEEEDEEEDYFEEFG